MMGDGECGALMSTYWLLFCHTFLSHSPNLTPPHSPHPHPSPLTPLLPFLTPPPTNPPQAFFLLRQHTLLTRQGAQLALAVAEDVEDLQAALVKIADDKVSAW